jgi:hypothetical protein
VLDFVASAVKRPGKQRHKVWEDGYDAKDVFSPEFLRQKMTYIHNNPCQSHWRLAERPEEYVWSSARFYLLEEPAIIPLDNASHLLVQAGGFGNPPGATGDTWRTESSPLSGDRQIPAPTHRSQGIVRSPPEARIWQSAQSEGEIRSRRIVKSLPDARSWRSTPSRVDCQSVDLTIHAESDRLGVTQTVTA